MTLMGNSQAHNYIRKTMTAHTDGLPSIETHASLLVNRNYSSTAELVIL